MRFHVKADLKYEAKFPSTLILNIQAQRNRHQVVLDEHLTIDPALKVAEFVDRADNRFIKLETGSRKQIAIAYSATVECDFQTYRANAVEPTPVAELDAAALPYLFPSRYCQSDRLNRLAWDLFGAIQNPHEKVVAICDWIHENVEYRRGTTDSMTSAFDTVTQRTGVCRDFAHLGIALCRALNVPARYFAGYAYELDPPDFHACFECFIGGSWTVFDATRLAHLNGLVRVGTGRDAAEAAVASIFGSARCTTLAVSCELADGQHFTPIDRKQLNRRGVALAPSA
jgi:transglutaminase-like putative cysteine protease